MDDPQAVGPAQLRAFGIVLGVSFAIIFGIALPWIWGLAWPRWPWVVFAVLSGWALVHPRSLAPIHAAWMKVGHVLGTINNHVIL